MQVRPSPINGRGVFATVPLPARKKLGELTGQPVPLPQAWQGVERQAKIFMVEISPRLALDCSRGNALKHLNHSCAPNCYLRISRGLIEVYALQPIPAGTELTVDYGVTPHLGGMACACGAPACRGRL